MPSMDRLCCSTMLFGGHGRRDAFRTIADLGFPYVDIWASGYLGSQDAVGVPNLPRHADPDKDDVKAIKAELKEFGLQLHAVSIFRCDLPAKLRRIEFAAELGARCVIFCAEKITLEQFANETVTPVLKRCSELGVLLAIENHIDRAVDTTDSMLRLSEGFSDRAFGYALTPPHLVALGESPVAAVKALGASRIHSVYLWDLMTGYDKTRDSIFFGEGDQQFPGGGQIDFKPLLDALDAEGYKGEYNIGLHETSAWPLSRIREELSKSSEYLKGV